jgi:hypothetical protein
MVVLLFGGFFELEVRRQKKIEPGHGYPSNA